MIIEEIPRAFKYTCSRCGTEHIQRNASGHYTESTPPGWIKVRLVTRAADVAPKTQEVLICSLCAPDVGGAFDIMLQGLVREPEDMALTADHINYMVNRFLAWKLPAGFDPDGGISYSGIHSPTGTNLLSYEQAWAMVKFITDGMKP
jgi:hypothetical protein